MCYDLNVYLTDNIKVQIEKEWRKYNAPEGIEVRMLLGLHVKNFAIIDEVELDFRDNLNILSGETGSGKSILIGSLNCALGGRVSKEMIRKDAEFAYVELCFRSEDKCVKRVFEKYELPEDDGQILISRRIMQNGRSVVKVNGEPTTQAAVKELAEYLLDVHGQHEHQSLLYKKNHLEILDRFAKKQEESVLPAMREAYQEYSRCKKALQEEQVDEAARQREISLLEYECNEIEAAELSVGEEEELQARYRILSNQRQITEAINQVYQLTAEQDGSAAELVQHAWKSVDRIAELDERIGGMRDTLSDIESMLSDFNREVSAYLSDLQDEDTEELSTVSARLDLIHHLESKYGKDEAAVLKYLAEAREKLNKYADYDNYIAELERKKIAAEASVIKYSEELSAIRKEAAVGLAEQITEALNELNFLQVEFTIQLAKSAAYSANGNDEAEFMISLNPGETPAPLAKIASGGELSRIMLGIKSVLADKDAIETLIFDEIDSGISGRTAQKVAERLAVIAKNHQVICITHLPQIAAMADSHYLIEKQSDGAKTATDVILLSEEAVTQELARMLGGVTVTDSVLQSAREMRELAESVKKSLRNPLKNE